MISYKLVQLLKNYINLQEIGTLIVICLHIVQPWLHKLRYLYKDLCKNVFVKSDKQSDVVENRANFLNQIEELKPYMVEFIMMAQ